MPNKKKKKQLPNKILALPNKDKTFHEKWSDIPNRNMLNFPHPFRAVIFAVPNCGKTCIAINIILRANPPFKKLYVVHIDGDYTKEYEDVDAEMLDEIPPPDSEIFDGEDKTLIILEDLEFKFTNKWQLRNLDRLMGYVSTHKNVSVIILAQDAFNLPPTIRRMSNVWILGKVIDKDSLYMMGRKMGLTKEKLRELYEKYVIDCHDFLYVDNTKNSPYPLRRNGFEIIGK